MQILVAQEKSKAVNTLELEGFDDITVAVPGSDPTDLLDLLNSIGGVEVISINPVE